MSDKTTLHLNIDTKVLEKYKQVYKRDTRTRLVENLFRLVVDDRDLFDRIFFMDLLNGSFVNH